MMASHSLITTAAVISTDLVAPFLVESANDSSTNHNIGLGDVDRSDQRETMLVALFTILLLGDGSTGVLDFIADSRDAVKVVMEKDDRQKEALSTLKAMKKRAAANNKELKRTSKELERALSTDEDIDAIWDAYFTQRDTYNRDMLDLRFQLRDQLTREEWERVFEGYR